MLIEPASAPGWHDIGALTFLGPGEDGSKRHELRLFLQNRLRFFEELARLLR